MVGRTSQRGIFSRLSECPPESENVSVGGIGENVEEHILIIRSSRGRLRSRQAVASLFLLPLPVVLDKMVIQNYQSAYLQLK